MENPTLVITTGISGTGKTTVLKEYCRQTPDTIYLEKDGVNQSLLVVRPTDQGQIPSIPATLGGYHMGGKAQPFTFYNGDKMWEVSFATEFYGRHVRDQTYLAFENIARHNLGIGKTPVIDCLVHRQVGDQTLEGFMQAFSGHPVAFFHFVAPGEVIRERLRERLEKDPYAAVRDREKVESDKAWERFITEEQPILWPQLDFFHHKRISTGKPVQDCVEQIIDYVRAAPENRDDLLTRVNESGNILGGVHYRIAHPQDQSQEGVRHRTVNAAVFKDERREEIALQMRGEKVHKPGVWDISVGGHNVYGQTPLETVQQEAREEIFNNDPLPEGLEFREVLGLPKQTRPNDPEFVVLYEAFHQGPFDPNPEEVSEVKFFRVDEVLANMRTSPNKYTNSLKVTLPKLLEAVK